MIRLPRANYKQMPWKNGLGSTAEIDRVPDQESYHWRLSQASIQSNGPFSTFPGYDRWLVILSGDPIYLNDKKILPLEPILFSGDENINCRLSEKPVQDLGFIFDRSKVESQMRFVQGEVFLSEIYTNYVYDLASGDTLKIEQGTELVLGPSVLITVSYKDAF